MGCTHIVFIYLYIAGSKLQIVDLQSQVYTRTTVTLQHQDQSLLYGWFLKKIYHELDSDSALDNGGVWIERPAGFERVRNVDDIGKCALSTHA
jgi:hypothetical protein